MRTLEIKTKNLMTVLINTSNISSIEIRKTIEKFCDEKELQEMEFFEVEIIMNNGIRYVDHQIYSEISEIEYI